MLVNDLKEKGIRRIVLFGSHYTMHGSYISSALHNNNIETILPTLNEMNIIDNIRIKVYNNTVIKNDIELFNDLVLNYNKIPVVIACTELSIVLNSQLLNTIDLVKLQLTDL